MKSLKNNKGFSLIELIISLGLITLVISSTSMFYFTGMKGWTKNSSYIDIQQNLRIAMNTLNTELQEANTIEIISEHEMKLDNSKTYKFNRASNELRLGSSVAVAMYIKDCTFEYDENLVKVKITTIADEKEGIKERTYGFSINTRGKEIL